MRSDKLLKSQQMRSRSERTHKIMQFGPNPIDSVRNASFFARAAVAKRSGITQAGGNCLAVTPIA
jgi:hypothetical protein